MSAVGHGSLGQFLDGVSFRVHMHVMKLDTAMIYASSEEFRAKVRDTLQLAYAVEHAPTDDLPELWIQCLALTGRVGVWEGVGPLGYGKQDCRLILTVVFGIEDEVTWLPVQCTHN